MIYFVQIGNAGPIKIGCTGFWPERLKTHQRKYLHPLMILGVMHGDRKKEAEIHARFKPFRLPPDRSGGERELFLPHAKLLDYISRHCCPVAEYDGPIESAYYVRLPPEMVKKAELVAAVRKTTVKALLTQMLIPRLSQAVKQAQNQGAGE